MSKAYDLTTTSNKIQTGTITTDNTGQYTSGGFVTGPHYVAPPAYGQQGGDPLWQPGSQEQPVKVIKIEDDSLEYLIEMLELDESSTGLCLEVNGKKYSLTDILHAQMKYMVRLNVLLVHRQLGRANAED